MFNPPIRMTLCPNCRTIQRHGSTCTICKKPIVDAPVDTCPGCGKAMVVGTSCQNCGYQEDQ